jgi:hypothetical protein
MAGSLRSIGWGPPQSPALNFVLSNESQLLVQGFALRCGIQLERGDLLIIDVPDRTLQKLGSHPSPAALWIDKNHPDPRKSTLE